MNNNLKETQVMQIIITVFYGQFLSTAVFENIIGAIPDLVQIYKYLEEEEEASKGDDETFNPKLELILKLCLGVCILLISIFGLFAVWTRRFRFVMLSGIFLFVIFITSLLISTIHLTLKFEQMTKMDRFKLIAKLSFEAAFQLVGICATFQINLLTQLESQNKIINVLINHVDLLQNNFDHLIPELKQNVKLEPDLILKLEENIKKAKILRKKSKSLDITPSRTSIIKTEDKRYSLITN